MMVRVPAGKCNSRTGFIVGYPTGNFVVGYPTEISVVGYPTGNFIVGYPTGIFVYSPSIKVAITDSVEIERDPTMK